MKVKFENIKYKVSFCDKIHIEFLKFILFCKRQKRRFTVFFTKDSLGVYFIISVLWALFAVATYFCGQDIKGTEKNPYTISQVFWDLKNPYFTSVILTFAINSMNRIKEYKRLIRAQHCLYVDAMDDFESIFNQYLGDKIYYYKPLYCNKTLKNTMEYILEKSSVKKDDNEQKLVFNNILKRLEELEKYCKNELLVGTDTTMFLYYIDNSQKTLTKSLVGNTYNKIEDLQKVAEDLINVLDYIRMPWRIDIQTKIKILSILDMYPSNEIQEDFYYSMLLKGYSFEETFEEESNKD